MSDSCLIAITSSVLFSVLFKGKLIELFWKCFIPEFNRGRLRKKDYKRIKEIHEAIVTKPQVIVVEPSPSPRLKELPDFV